MGVILGGTHEVEQVEENMEGRLSILVLSQKLYHLHISPSSRMKLGEGNLQVFHDNRLKFRKGKTQSYLGEPKLIK